MSDLIRYTCSCCGARTSRMHAALVDGEFDKFCWPCFKRERPELAEECDPALEEDDGDDDWVGDAR